MVSKEIRDIIFRNISNGEITTETRGIQAFRKLAEQSSTTKKFIKLCYSSLKTYSPNNFKIE